MGFGSGAAETLAPISIADIFFLHERGRVMSAYTCFLSVGAAGGLVVSGLITINHTWRTIYQVGAALVGFVLLLLIFTVPETSYLRTDHYDSPSADASDGKQASAVREETQASTKKLSYIESLLVFKAAGTGENIFKMMIRPFGLIILPPVLWAALSSSNYWVSSGGYIQLGCGFQPDVRLCFLPGWALLYRRRHRVSLRITRRWSPRGQGCQHLNEAKQWYSRTRNATTGGDDISNHRSTCSHSIRRWYPV